MAEFKKNLNDILHTIQKELKAPKGQFNSFGNYKYRSLEDILAAVKPHMPPGVVLNFTDDLVQIGDRYYVKSTATISYEGQEASSTSFAREAITKKGMDEAQISGSAGSYARKYALAGLIICDDNPDEDTQTGGIAPVEKAKATKKSDVQEKAKVITNDEAMELLGLIKTAGYEEQQIKEYYKVTDWLKCTPWLKDKITLALQKKINEKGGK